MNHTGENWHAQQRQNVVSPPSRWVGDGGFDSVEMGMTSPPHSSHNTQHPMKSPTVMPHLSVDTGNKKAARALKALNVHQPLALNEPPHQLAQLPGTAVTDESMSQISG